MRNYIAPSLFHEDIPKEEINMVYNLVEKSIDEIDTHNKSTNEIFGEIYTRFRTKVSYLNRSPKLKKLFRCKLNSIRRTEFGKQLNKIINEVYQTKVKKEHTLNNLELYTIMMNECLSDAKKIDMEANKVILTLTQIDRDLNGENYV